MRLATLFSDNAVLQRDMEIPVWGWMTPNSLVIVKLGSNCAKSMSGGDGKFMVKLPPMPAGGPYKLEVEGPTTKEKAGAKDIMVGEVWVASGQSNMEFTFDMLGQSELDKLKNPAIRMITVPRQTLCGRQTDFNGEWLSGDSDNLCIFSAVAYHFAARLQKELKVTVGIITAAWGGTIIEAWTSRETLVQNPEMNHEIKHYEAKIYSPEFWDEFEGLDLTNLVASRAMTNAKKNYPLDPGNDGEAKGWAKPGYDDSEWQSMKLPGSWKLQGVPFNGAVWFRLNIDIPASWVGKELSINIGAVDKHDITYFNGERIGATGTGFEEQHWNIPRKYEIPARLVKAGKGVIAVRAYSFVYDGGLIGPTKDMRIAPAGEPEKGIHLAGKWLYKVEHDLGNIGGSTSSSGPGNPNSPYILFDSIIAPLIPYAVRGAIWYQGESNESNWWQYRQLHTDMIRDWRFAWGQDNFQFLFVQLANFRSAIDYADNAMWPYVREAQTQTLEMPGTGMAVTIDIGEEMDIHPKNKFDVGNRLALWALRDSYHFNIVPSGPIYRNMVIEGNRIRLFFNYVGNGLVAGNGELKTFMIAGDNRMFYPATAVIEGNSVVVKCPEVPGPCAVRYAWSDNPAGCNLYNSEKLPASPFRTDTWR